MKKINMFDLWERNWENASRFFQSKGKATTRSKLKDKWYKEFVNDLKSIERTITENLTKHNNDFKKPCPQCDGNGEVRSATKDINGYDLEECPSCEGQGFIKSRHYAK